MASIDEIPSLLDKANALLDSGQIEQAHTLFSRVCSLDDTNAEAWLMLGAIHGELGDANQAEHCLRRAIDHHPDFPDAHFTLAHVLHAQGRHDDALHHFREAARGDSNFGDAYLAVAKLLVELNRPEEALPAAQQAVHAEPRLAEGWQLLGWIQQALGRHREAAQSYQQALATGASGPTLHAALGDVLKLSGDLAAALSSYDQAVKLGGASAALYNNLGTTHQALGDLATAADCYRRSLEINPDSWEAAGNLGDVLQMQGQPDASVPHYRDALARNPNAPRADLGLGCALRELGDYPQAVEHLERHAARRGSDAARLLAALTLPVIAESRKQIDEVRARLQARLTELVAAGPVIEDPGREIDHLPFFLAYHGRDNLALLRQLHDLYRCATPGLTHVAEHCRQERRGDGKISVGFISRFLTNHSVGTATRGLITAMPREKFEITVFAPPQKDDRGIETLRDRVDHFIPLPADLTVARRHIESRRLDVLCYLDIGMDPLTYFLAYSRLAPVQCTTWGHPETSGIDTIDYYLSSRDFEPDSGDTHYSERLVRLAHPPVVIARPAVPTAATPGHFGLGDDRHVYLCPQSLFKIHPDMDELFAALLRRDARAVVVLCDGPFRRWSELLGARFTRAIPDVADRIRFLPRQGYEDYLRLLARADVVLDTLHFGGGITSYEALAVGAPIVTLPGEFMRGRSTAGCYRRMGYTDWVATDRDDYVERALALGGDAGLRDEARRRILAANDVLYANTAAARDLGLFFEEALAAVPPAD